MSQILLQNGDGLLLQGGDALLLQLDDGGGPPPVIVGVRSAAANNAETTLAQPKLLGEFDLVLSDASKFRPFGLTAPTAERWMRITAWESLSARVPLGMWKCTGRTGNTLHCTEAIEGFPDVALPAGVIIRNVLTAGDVEDMWAYMESMLGRIEALEAFHAE